MGAELQSIKNVRNGIEYLWQGNPEFWNGRAPLLFPIVGRLKNKTYTLGGTPYTINLHGFARKTAFRAEKKSGSVLSFFLADSPETRASWPFEFELEIRYTLAKNALKKEHILHNRSASEMLYEIGGHDGYNVALFPGEKMEDYYIQFEGMDSIQSLVSDADVMITREKKTLRLENGRLRLDMGLFDGDALILDNVRNRRVTIANDRNGEKVRVSFPDFAWLGIWTKPGKAKTNYVCIEPWSSLPDCTWLDDKLENKLGVRHLAAKASETLAYTMEFGELQP
jgi:galactose mutarotase-like enzyme